jgi:hypothetical protein
MEDDLIFFLKEDDLIFLMEDDLKNIMQHKTFKSKTLIVAPLRVT